MVGRIAVGFMGMALFVFALASCGNNPSKAPTAGKANVHDQGQLIYSRTCATCHQPDGNGIPGTFPPLAKSDFLARGTDKAIVQVSKGSSGPLTVNGTEYNNIMPPQGLSDEETAAVLVYVYGHFGNKGDSVTPAEVKAVRARMQ